MVTNFFTPANADRHTTETTLSLEREFGENADLFVEYTARKNVTCEGGVSDMGPSPRFSSEALSIPEQGSSRACLVETNYHRERLKSCPFRNV
jgi:hypothetical protein